LNAKEKSVGNEKKQGPFCRRTRREFLWEAGGGFTGVALTALLSQDGFFAAETARSANPLAPRPAAFQPQGQERHLAVHVRRAQPRRYLRL
jgi:hypothetical protein